MTAAPSSARQALLTAQAAYRDNPSQRNYELLRRAEEGMDMPVRIETEVKGLQALPVGQA